MRGNGIEHTTTGGAGDLTLAAVTGKPTYASVFGSTGSRLVEYTVLDSANVPVEGGMGVVNLSTLVLTRTRAEWTWSGTTYNANPSGPSAIASGSQVICAPQAGMDLLTIPGRPTATFSGIHQPANFVSGGNWGYSGNLASNYVFFTPYLWAVRKPVSTFYMHTHTLGASGCRTRYALYEMLPTTGLPGRLVLEGAAEDTTDASNGAREVSFGATVVLPPGWYWFAVMNNSLTNNTLQYRILTSIGFAHANNYSGNLAAGSGALGKTITYGTFATAVGDNPTGLGLTGNTVYGGLKE
jgi:hypothetical protein